VEDVFPLLSSFHSLLILQQDANHPIRPFHKSFPDFLVDPTRCINPRFRVSPPDHHSELVIGCLELMNRRLKKNMFGFQDGSANDEADGLRKRAEGDIDHGLRYACELWHKHLIDADAAPTHTANITSILHQFLEQKFVFWLEVLSILGTLRSAVNALEVAAKLLEVCRNSMHDEFPEFSHTGSRDHRLLTSSTTASDLSPDFSRSSAYPLHISIARPFLCPPERQSCGDCMTHMLIL